MATKKSVKNYLESEALWGIDDFHRSKIRPITPKLIKKRAAPSESIPSSKNKTQLLKKLFDLHKDCKKCPLGVTRLNFVFGVGNPDSPLVFVGEGPGYDEDHQGEPFVGRAGQLLNKIISAMTLKREDVYIANITKCHPMIDPSNPHKRGNDRPPTLEEMESCMPILEEQLKIISPRVICTLGATAAKGLLKTDAPIGTLRGKVFDYQLSDGKNIKLVPTYHPAALLRNPVLKKPCWEDIKTVMKLLGLKIPR